METTLVYKPFTIPIKIVPPQLNIHGSIQFELYEQIYSFIVHEWGKGAPTNFHVLVDTLFSISGDEMLKKTARDIVTGILNITYIHQSKILDYTVYHLKHFPLGDNATYSDVIMDAACNAIIDCNFFAPTNISYKKINLDS